MANIKYSNGSGGHFLIIDAQLELDKLIDSVTSSSDSFSSSEDSENSTNKIIKNKYNCIVFDLDGTLVYTDNKNRGNGEKINFEDIHGDMTTLWVHKRPYFDELLKHCFEHLVVGVWSMGQPGYVQAVVNLFPQNPRFVYNWCDCDRSNTKIYKNLNNIPYDGNILMVDDNPRALEYSSRVDTYIIKCYHPNNRNDIALKDLLPMLF